MATMREWNVRSRSCWAIAALAMSAVALGVTADQVSAFVQKRTPTGRVSLAEWKHWDNEVTRLNASFNADRNLLWRPPALVDTSWLGESRQPFVLGRC